MHLGPPQPKLGEGMVHCTQAKLNLVLLQEALATGCVQIHFNTEFCSILSNNHDGVKVLARDVTTGENKQFQADYAVAADGAKSKVRKALKLPFPGHTWPERLIAMDVLRMNDELPPYLTSFVMHDVYWTINTPLEWPIKGERSLWRYSMAQDPEDMRTDEEILSDDHLMSLLRRRMIGPDDQSVTIQKRSVYRNHQRLTPTFRRQRVVLAGDAAHLNNPVGALGLNTGLLDADAIAETLIMILKEGYSDELLNAYSDQRRRVFQEYTDPTSKANKLRLQLSPETAVQDDWLFRMLARGPTPKEIADLSRPIWNFWRTDMRQLAKDLNIPRC